MTISTSLPRPKGFRFPREIIAYAVWAYHWSALSTADVEDLLAERGVIVSREAIRLWVKRFGPQFATNIRRDRPRPNNKWHMDEVVVPINGVKHWLWRAIDGNGDVLDILISLAATPKPQSVSSADWLQPMANRVLSSRTNCAAIPSRSRSLRRMPTIGRTRGSTTGSKGNTGRRESGKR